MKSEGRYLTEEEIWKLADQKTKEYMAMYVNGTKDLKAKARESFDKTDNLAAFMIAQLGMFSACFEAHMQAHMAVSVRHSEGLHK